MRIHQSSYHELSSDALWCIFAHDKLKPYIVELATSIPEIKGNLNKLFILIILKILVFTSPGIIIVYMDCREKTTYRRTQVGTVT